MTDPVTGGTETYILVPASRLPLLGPLRDIAYHLGVSAPAERLLGLIEPLLRVIVDMGYTDRLNLNPEVRKPFSLFTPPHKVIEALNAVPGAVREGVENLLGIKRTPAAPVAPPATATAATRSATEPETDVEIGAAPEDETSSADDLATPPKTLERTAGGGPVVTVRDAPRRAFGGNRTAPRTAGSPARSAKSGHAGRDGGAEAA